MTQTLGINGDNDIYLDTKGNIALLSGEPAVEGACQTASQAQLGEMQYEATNGIPNFQTVWVGVPTPAIFESYLRKTLQAIDGVVAVKSIAVQIQNNKLTYAAVIENAFGNEVTLNG